MVGRTGAVGQADFVVNEVARVLGISDEPGRPVVDMVVDFLRSKSPLILLDNCEHIIGAVAVLVEGLLASCPTLTIVCTSREALGVRGETVLQVPSLALPPPAPGSDRRRDPTRLVRDDRFHRGSPAIRRPGQRGPEFVFSRPRTTPRPWSRSVAGSMESRLRSNWRRPESKLLSAEEIALRLSDRFPPPY